MGNFGKISAIEGEQVNVIIETPRDSCLKYRFDEEREIYVADKILPVGMTFPLDFGFIPGTKGEDGDPLDALILMDRPGLQNSLVECRLIGSMKASQKERDGTIVRNDRYLVVCRHTWVYNSLKDFVSLGEIFLQQLETFFINYNFAAGKEFRPLGWDNAETAMKSLIKGCLSPSSNDQAG